MIMKANTEVRKFLGTWLRECCRQVEAEVISNSRNKLHQTTYKEIFFALYDKFPPLLMKCELGSQSVHKIDRIEH